MKCKKLAKYEQELQALLSDPARWKEADAVMTRIRDHKMNHSSNLAGECDPLRQ